MTQFRIAKTSELTPEAAARRIADVGVIASLFVAPLWFGGRHDLGFFWYAVAVAVAAIGAFAHAAIAGSFPKIGGTPIALIAAAIGLLVLQVVPLPPELHAWLAPYAEQMFPLWGDGEHTLSVWRTLSVAPVETREGLALLTCHALLFCSVAIRLRSVEDVRNLLQWVGYAGAAMAALAFAQYAFGNGKLLWLYPHPHRDMGDAVQGVFTNRNHFAQFMALAGGPLCLSLIAATRGRNEPRGVDKRFALAVGLVSLTTVAGLASQSRGGAAAMVAAAVTVLVIAWRCGAISRSRTFALVFAALAVFSGVSLFGYDKIAGRLDDITSGDVDTLDAGGARRAIWAANVEAFRASPLFGFGAGTHRDYYPVYLEEAYPREFTHAESGYLQIAGETGGFGLLLLACGAALIGWWIVVSVTCDRDASRRMLWIGVAPGLVASFTHSAVDFVWYTPGLTAVTAALAACAMRLYAFASGEQTPRRRRSLEVAEVGVGALARVTVAATLSALAIGTLWPAARGSLDWDRYLRVSKALAGISSKLARDASSADESLGIAMASNTEHSTEVLRRVVAADPGNARAHLRLAGRLLQRFELESAHRENGMTVELIRGAATGGGFSSHGEMLEWLDRAFGDRAMLLRLAHAHARRAVELAPLQGDAYLYLASLSFLDPSGPTPSELVSQALAVRPYDGEVLFEAGRQRHLAGDAEAAIDLWRGCARRPGSHPLKLVMLLAGGVSAQDFVETLQPNHAVLLVALARYREIGSKDDLVALAEYARELVLAAEEEGQTEPAGLAHRWILVSRTLRAVDDFQSATDAAQRAAVLAPYLFPARLELAGALRDAERFEEADTHIRWCLARRPDIRYLHVWLTESAKRRTEVDRNRRSRRRLYEEVAAKTLPSQAVTESSGSSESTAGRR